MDKSPVIEEVDEVAIRSRKIKKWLLVGMLLTAYLSGIVASVYYMDEDWLDLVGGFFWISLAILVFVWMDYDARQHFYRIRFPMRVAMVILPPAVFLYYLFRLRGIRAIYTLILACLFFLLITITFALGIFLGLLVHELLLS